MTVKQVQLLLCFLGYDPGEHDGIWGNRTMAALKDFQADFGIQADGYPGEQTYKALRSAVCYGMTERKEDAATDPEPEDDACADDRDLTGAEKYLQADGCYHIPRGVDVQLTKNFRASEIHCQGSGCCTESVISKRIMTLAQAIRDDMGVPLAIGSAGGSGYRCRKHNTEVGGASGSLHMISDAVDIHYRDPAKLKECIMRHLVDGEVGLYPWGCHVGRWDRGYISEFS